MKRKVIKQGQGGLTIHLPKKWAEQESVNPGDEINVEIDERILHVSTQNSKPKEKKIERDISKLDRTGILKLFTALYDNGYSEIIFRFDKNNCYDQKKKKNVSIVRTISHYAKRFEGFVIISQTKNSITIKDISMQKENTFEAILRRIFFSILEFNKSISEALETNDFSDLSNAQERHDNITSLTSYCLRVLQKENRSDGYNVYHMLSILDIITDYNRYLCDDLLQYKVSKETKKLLQETLKQFRRFNECYYDPSDEKMTEFIKSRFSLKDKINKGTIPTKEKMTLMRFNTTNRLLFSLTKNLFALQNKD